MNVSSTTTKPMVKVKVNAGIFYPEEKKAGAVHVLAYKHMQLNEGKDTAKGHQNSEIRKNKREAGKGPAFLSLFLPSSFSKDSSVSPVLWPAAPCSSHLHSTCLPSMQGLQLSTTL